ncbi:MAG: spsA, partial [Frankiales bacterium]|nr:spsA [Frankiales bacterium]
MAVSVQVLLPVFDGERHLAELVDSLGRQEHRPTSLLVRDDGSSDRGLDVLREAAARCNLPLRLLPPGPRLGPFRSFLQLLAEADPDVDLVAFADQDDVWLPDKLARAVRALDGVPSPACYGSSVQVTDARLRPLSRTAGPPGGPSFLHALVEAIAPVSTVVLPQATRRLLLQRLPDAHVYPDLWCYQVCVALGRFLYDPEPSLLYRQHDSNALGLATTTWGRWTGRLRRAVKDVPGLGTLHWGQLAELDRLYDDLLSPDQRRALAALLDTRRSWRASAAYALRGPVVRRTAADALA